MNIDNKHRSTSWENVAKEMQSERDAARSEVLRLNQEVWLRDAEIERLRAERAGVLDTFAENEKLRCVREALKEECAELRAEVEALKAQVERLRTHSGFVYEYPSPFGGSVLRFNSGEEVNGYRPTRAIPYVLLDETRGEA